MRVLLGNSRILSTNDNREQHDSVPERDRPRPNNRYELAKSSLSVCCIVDADFTVTPTFHKLRCLSSNFPPTRLSSSTKSRRNSAVIARHNSFCSLHILSSVLPNAIMRPIRRHSRAGSLGKLQHFICTDCRQQLRHRFSLPSKGMSGSEEFVAQTGKFGGKELNSLLFPTKAQRVKIVSLTNERFYTYNCVAAALRFYKVIKMDEGCNANASLLQPRLSFNLKEKAVMKISKLARSKSAILKRQSSFSEPSFDFSDTKTIILSLIHI